MYIVSPSNALIFGSSAVSVGYRLDFPLKNAPLSGVMGRFPKENLFGCLIV